MRLNVRSIRTSRHLMIAIGVIALLVLLGVLGATFGRRQMVANALSRLFTADTYHTKAELDLNLPPRFQGRERPFTEVTFTLEGDVALAPDRTPEFTGTLFGESRGRGNVFFVNGDIRILRDVVLFRLENLPVLLNPSGSLVKKWTRVETPLLQTANGTEARNAIELAASSLSFQGRERVEGQMLAHFSGSFTPEQEDALMSVLQQQQSGNRGLHVIARLLQAHNVKSADVWIHERSREVRRIRLNFVRPLAAGGEFDFATLQLTFQDYGKDVTIDRPSSTLVVQPGVFTKLFGGGEIEAVQ